MVLKKAVGICVALALFGCDDGVSGKVYSGDPEALPHPSEVPSRTTTLNFVKGPSGHWTMALLFAGSVLDEAGVATQISSIEGETSSSPNLDAARYPRQETDQSIAIRISRKVAGESQENPVTRLVTANRLCLIRSLGSLAGENVIIALQVLNSDGEAVLYGETTLNAAQNQSSLDLTFADIERSDEDSLGTLIQETQDLASPSIFICNFSSDFAGNRCTVEFEDAQSESDSTTEGPLGCMIIDALPDEPGNLVETGSNRCLFLLPASFAGDFTVRSSCGGDDTLDETTGTKAVNENAYSYKDLDACKSVSETIGTVPKIFD